MKPNTNGYWNRVLKSWLFGFGFGCVAVCVSALCLFCFPSSKTPTRPDTIEIVETPGPPEKPMEVAVAKPTEEQAETKSEATITPNLVESQNTPAPEIFEQSSLPAPVENHAPSNMDQSEEEQTSNSVEGDGMPDMDQSEGETASTSAEDERRLKISDSVLVEAAEQVASVFPLTPLSLRSAGNGKTDPDREPGFSALWPHRDRIVIRFISYVPNDRFVSSSSEDHCLVIGYRQQGSTDPSNIYQFVFEETGLRGEWLETDDLSLEKIVLLNGLLLGELEICQLENNKVLRRVPLLKTIKANSLQPSSKKQLSVSGPLVWDFQKLGLEATQFGIADIVGSSPEYRWKSAGDGMVEFWPDKDYCIILEPILGQPVLEKRSMSFPISFKEFERKSTVLDQFIERTEIQPSQIKAKMEEGTKAIRQVDQQIVVLQRNIAANNNTIQQAQATILKAESQEKPNQGRIMYNAERLQRIDMAKATIVSCQERNQALSASLVKTGETRNDYAQKMTMLQNYLNCYMRPSTLFGTERLSFTLYLKHPSRKNLRLKILTIPPAKAMRNIIKQQEPDQGPEPEPDITDDAGVDFDGEIDMKPDQKELAADPLTSKPDATSSEQGPLKSWQPNQTDLGTAPPEYLKRVRETAEEIEKSSTYFAVGGQVLDQNGSRMRKGAYVVSFNDEYDTYRFDGGWFLTERLYGLKHPAKLVVSTFLHDRVEIPLEIEGKKIHMQQIVMERTPSEKQMTIDGIVQDENGQPIVGADVTLMLGRMKKPLETPLSFNGVTNDGGRYLISQITSQSYDLRISSKRHSNSYALLKIESGSDPTKPALEKCEDGLSRKENDRIVTNLLFPRKVLVDVVYAFDSTNFNGANVRKYSCTLELFGSQETIAGHQKTGRAIVLNPFGRKEDKADMCIAVHDGKCSFGHYLTRGKVGHYALGEVDFDSVSEVDPTKIQKDPSPCELNHVYVVRTYEKGHYAKIVVRSIEIMAP